MSLNMETTFNFEKMPPTLLSLPVELHQEIASYLDDFSLCAFRLTCKMTQAGVDGHYETFWHKHFANTFDAASDANKMNPLKYKHKYQLRKRVLNRKNTDYKIGYRKKEKIAAEVLIDLAKEAQPELDENNMPQSKNFDFMTNFCKSNPGILGCIFKHKFDMTKVKPEMLMAQVLIAPITLDPNIPQAVYSFPDSQAMVYASPAQAPLLFGRKKLEVNIPWVVHVVNFFRYHMLRPEEATLFSAFGELSDAERPHLWTEKIADVPEAVLGKVWKGTYSYVDVPEVMEIRQRLDNSTIGTRHRQEILMDRNVDMGHRAMQVVKFYRTEKPSIKWPPKFERILNTHWYSPLAPPTRSNPPPRFYFEGVGFDDEKFYMAGFTYPLTAQQGVPGWHRIVMMKYFMDEDTGSYENDALWAYEGVILPGGQLIVGRWWAPEDPVDLTTHDNVYSGPFIFWNIDASIPAEERGPGSATGFDVDSLHQKALALATARGYDPNAEQNLSAGLFEHIANSAAILHSPPALPSLLHQHQLAAVTNTNTILNVQPASTNPTATNTDFMTLADTPYTGDSTPVTPVMAPARLAFLDESPYSTISDPTPCTYPADFGTTSELNYDDGEASTVRAAEEDGDEVGGAVRGLPGFAVVVSGAGAAGVGAGEGHGRVVVEELDVVETGDAAARAVYDEDGVVYLVNVDFAG